MLGVAILIIVMSVMNGFRTDLTNKILGLNPHITIEPNGAFIDKDFKSKLENNYQDFTITKSYNGEGIVIIQNFAKGIIVKGAENNKNNSLNFLKEKLIKGSFQDFNKGSILIGTELSFNLGLEVGDNLNLMTSAFINTPIGGLPKQETFKIAGIFNSGFFEFDQNVVFVNIDDALSLFNKTEKDISIEIFLKNPLKANHYKEEIKKINNNLYVYSWTDINKSFFSALKVERNVMFLILTLIIVVAAFNIISGLTILIKNKTKEIAILKTMGLSNLSIKKSFFLTGLTIGFLASVAGVVLGVIFSIYIEEIRNFLSIILKLEIFPPDVYFLEKMPSEIDLFSISIIFLFSLLISALASYFPANIISKMKTTEALKYE